MKWRLGAFASMIILMVFVLTACDKPNADYLRKRLAGDADFYALFDPHVEKDIDKYTITDVTVTYEHEENKGYMELSARITCTSEEAVFTGSFDIVLKKYGKGWDIDKMALNDYDFDVKVGPTEALIQSNWPVERLKASAGMLDAAVTVDEIRHKPDEPLAEADLTVSLGTNLAQVTLPVTLYLIYDGAWTVVANSVEYASEKDILALADFSLTVPTGTYQYYDMGGMLYSIRIFETPDDLENPYHCDIILYNEVWNPIITNDYFGPVELTDELDAIICGGICFGFDAAGAPYLVEPRMLYDGSIVDSIKRYSGGSGLADGLNALIDLAETSGQPLSNHAVTVYAHEYGIAEEDILRGETTSKEDMDAYMEIALLDPLFNPDDPAYIYTPAEDGAKSDGELTEREFEQKYGYFYGYCMDFGKTHILSSDYG